MADRFARASASLVALFNQLNASVQLQSHLIETQLAEASRFRPFEGGRRW